MISTPRIPSATPLDTASGFQAGNNARSLPAKQSNDTVAQPPYVPVGFPSSLTGPMTWDGKDFSNHPEEYVYELNAEEIKEIDNAITYFQGTNLHRGYLNPLTFPLPKHLCESLKTINEIVYNGHGFVVLRGLDPTKYDEEQIIMLYAGTASYVADRRGNTLDHIVESRELRTSETQMDLAGAEQDGPMMFHTDFDSGSLLSLFSHTLSRAGGKQHLVSFWSIYNTLAKSYPGVLETLSQKFEW